MKPARNSSSATARKARSRNAKDNGTPASAFDLPNFDEVFRAILGWDGLGFIFRIHGSAFGRVVPINAATVDVENVWAL
jgi:hypothetical protein